MHIAAFTHFVMLFLRLIVQKKVLQKTMKPCHFFLPTDMNEIKLERNNRKANVSLDMIHLQSIKINTMFLADFQRFSWSSF